MWIEDEKCSLHSLLPQYGLVQAQLAGLVDEQVELQVAAVWLNDELGFKSRPVSGWEGGSGAGGISALTATRTASVAVMNLRQERNGFIARSYAGVFACSTRMTFSPSTWRIASSL